MDGAIEHGEPVDRSIFKLLPVQQLLQALRHSGGAVAQDLRLLLQHTSARSMQSQVAEDGFKVCRKVGTLAQNKEATVQTLCVTMFIDGLLAKQASFLRGGGLLHFSQDGLHQFPW